MNVFLANEIPFVFLWFLGLNVLVSRFTASKYTHEVILVQITEDNNVNRHGLLRLCGANLRCGQVCCDGNTPGILSALALCRWDLWHDCIGEANAYSKDCFANLLFGLV